MKEPNIGRVIKTVIVYIFVLWCIAPVFWLISTSLKTDVQAFSPTPVWFFIPQFESYVAAWNDGGMGQAMIISTIVSVISSVLGIAAGLPLAYLSTQVWESESQGSARIILGILFMTTVPPILSLTPFYRAFYAAGLAGNDFGLIIVHSFYATLLAVLIFRSFLVSFSREIREAALIDGAGEWKALIQCILPNIWGGLFATFVLALIQSWNEFLYALVLTNGDSETVPVTIASFLGFFGTNWGRLTAAGVIGALPIIIFAILVRKHMAEGSRSGALSDTEETNMLRIGVIGLGAIGREHLDLYRALPGVNVTAIADFQRDTARSLASSGESQAFGSATELLESGLVDAVSLCTPDHLHYQDAIEVISSGTHLLLEKPISTNVEEADELVRISEANELIVMPGHTLRFMDKYVAAKSLFASGDFGGLVHGYARRNNKISVAERVAGRTSPTFFLGIHDIDAISWITGLQIVEVQAMETAQRTPDGHQAVATNATLRMENGALFQLEAAWGLPKDFPTDIDARFRIVGDRGELSLDIHDQGVRSFAGHLSYPAPSAFNIYGSAQGALYNELAAFVRSVASHTPPPISMREAAQSVRVAAAIDRAVASGRVEKV